MSVTIKQIALRAGLSVPTVSRILNNDSDLFRPETRDKVLLAAKELGYRPNSYRMALRTKKFNAIGLLFSAHPARARMYEETFRTLMEESHRLNQHLIIGQMPEDESMADAAVPKLLREWSVDGLLINHVQAVPAKIAHLIESNSIPTIWLDCKRDADCLYPDDLNGAIEATERLLQLGHRKVVFLDLQRDEHYSHVDRRLGYESAMRAAKLPSRLLIPEQGVPNRQRLEFLSRWLREQKPADLPTAALAYDADVAAPLYTAAVMAGISVPAQLSILTFHDTCVNATGVRISAMRLPAAEMAQDALMFLSEKIANGARVVPPQAVPLIYQQDGTTVAAPSK